MKKISSILVIFLLVSVLFSTGCATKMGTGAGIGALLGGGLGLITCHGDHRAACIAALSAGTGAVGGGIGNMLDERDKTRSDQEALLLNQQELASKNAELERRIEHNNQQMENERHENDAKILEYQQEAFEQFKAGYRKTVGFAKDSSTLTPTGLSGLQQIAKELAQLPVDRGQLVVSITGVSDGGRNSDLGLALRRASEVKKVLSSRGVQQMITTEAVTEINGVTRAAIITLQ